MKRRTLDFKIPFLCLECFGSCGNGRTETTYVGNNLYDFL